jgi:hypothetical protein
LRGALAVAIAAVLLLAGCSGPSTRDIRVLILDEEGHPVPGTLFYAEAYDESGPYAFYSSPAGTAGEVPQQAREPAKIAWRPGARIALAAFAPGYRPVVLRDPDGEVASDEIVMELVRLEVDGDAGDPELREALSRLGFPFADARPGSEAADLARQAAAPDYDDLRALLQDARQAAALP